MRIQEHIAKLSWTGADKVLAVLYGFVQILQFRSLSAEEFGVFALLNGLVLYVFAISDSFALQGMIRFGTGTQRASAVAMGVRWHVLGVGAIALLFGIIGIATPQEHDTGGAVLLALRSAPMLLCAGCLRVVGIRLLYRDIQMKEVFWVNFWYYGVMTALTLIFLANGLLTSSEHLAWITICGHAISSVVAVWSTRSSWCWHIDTEFSKHDFMRFGADQTLISIIHNGVRQLDVYAVQFFFGVGVVGLYNSAKTLFRVCTDLTDAIAGILYPIATRLYAEYRLQELTTILTKALSFLMVGFACISIASWVGVTAWLLQWVLPAHYAGAIHHVVVLTWIAPLLPLTMLGGALSGIGQSRAVLRAVWWGGLCGTIVLLLIGLLHQNTLVPLGYGTYLAVQGILYFRAMCNHIPFRVVDLGRALPDTLHFMRQVMQKISSRFS
jgi:O-antigen/teichoic acid export membrane protein